MAYFTCNVCRIDRPVSTRNWMKSQVTSIILNDSSVVGFYNACRYCSPDCWVDPPIPDGAPPPNTCIICREVRAATRQYWTPSQMKSIWALGTSVTTNHNCCRTCDPSCWVPTLGIDAPPSQNDRPVTLIPPTPLPPPSLCHTGPASADRVHQRREPTPPPPPPYPPPASPRGDSQSDWRPLPYPARPLIHQRPRWLDQVSIKNDISHIRRDVPAGFWDAVVRNLKKSELKELSWSGACFISNSPMGLEAITLSDGGADLRGEWVLFHLAAERIKDPSTPIFLDVGNSIYKQFLMQVWPRSQLWDSLSNQVRIGDIIEAVLGRVIIDWANALSHSNPNPHFVDSLACSLFKTMSRICLAAYCDSRRYGSYSFI